MGNFDNIGLAPSVVLNDDKDVDNINSREPITDKHIDAAWH